MIEIVEIFSGFGKWYISSRLLINVVMEQYMSAEALKTPMPRKFQRVRVKLDHVLFCFLLIFLFLFLRDHIRLIKVQKILRAFEDEEIPENHLLMMERRKRRLEEECKKFNGEKKLENLSHRWVNILFDCYHTQARSWLMVSAMFITNFPTQLLLLSVYFAMSEIIPPGQNLSTVAQGSSLSSMRKTSSYALC